MKKRILMLSALSVFLPIDVNASDNPLAEEVQSVKKQVPITYSKLASEEQDKESKPLTFNKVVYNHPDESDRLESSELFKKALEFANREEYEKAIPLFQKSAQYNVNAQYNLGVLYEYGLGCQKSLTKAKEYYTVASVGKHKKAEERYKELILSQGKESKSAFRNFFGF